MDRKGEKKKGYMALGALAVLAAASLAGSDPLYRGLEAQKKPVIYTAGTYTAEAKGHGGTVTAQVTVTNWEITDILLSGPDETEGLGAVVIEQLGNVMVEQQTADVDTVAGATITSTAVKEAVSRALRKAKGLPEEEAETEAAGEGQSAGAGESQPLETGEGTSVETQTGDGEIWEAGGMEPDVERSIFVNQDGNRFINEEVGLDEVRAALAGQPDPAMWVVMDSDGFSGEEENPQLEELKNLQEEGLAVQGETLEELAAYMGVSAENLIAAVEDFNSHAENKTADSFGRTLYSTQIDDGPFYAVRWALPPKAAGPEDAGSPASGAAESPSPEIPGSPAPEGQAGPGSAASGDIEETNSLAPSE